MTVFELSILMFLRSSNLVGSIFLGMVPALLKIAWEDHADNKFSLMDTLKGFFLTFVKVLGFGTIGEKVNSGLQFLNNHQLRIIRKTRSLGQHQPDIIEHLMDYAHQPPGFDLFWTQ
ncbi:hypothetical protein WICMUC_000630 [Wickerhamomyces mucosus]|uniref:Uncharacterized protein n=1 Tax=Wickerhamomyces mucosus TaxID=1378264 RepID=A0A9P8PYD4_9ASCO|nr:hypothetical protein WICMUC_000630 [Wickerhamomyces mucosus]